MNIQNLKRLRDVIAETETYNQVFVFHECGAPACLAGHAAFLARQDDVPNSHLQAWGVAEEWLDLTMAQSNAMFASAPLWNYSTTKEDALAMLDRAIETGEVRWGE